MKNVSQFTDKKTIEQEAAYWLIKLDGGEPLSTEERKELKQWMSASPSHRQELENLNQFWQNNVLTELMVPLTQPCSRSWLNWGNWQQPKKRLLASAFSLVFIAMSLVLLFYQPLQQTNGLYVTAVGQQKVIELADGSVVELNTNSQVRISYNQKYRNIHVYQGQVHFEVAKNKDLPFRVYAGNGRVQAVGTAFSVRIKDNALNVLVTEGTVALAALEPITKDDDAAKMKNIYEQLSSTDLGLLDSGQRASLQLSDTDEYDLQDIDLAISKVKEDEISKQQSWRQGWLVFNGEPLEQVVSEVSRYTTMSITITDEQTKKIPIGGRFRVGRVEDMFLALESSLGIKANKLGNNEVELKML